MKRSLYIGLMSGTSVDGVDAVLADFEDDSAPQVSKRVKSLAHAYTPFSPALRAEFNALMQSGPNEIERAGRAGAQLVHLYADAVKSVLHEAKIPAAQIMAIGAHGQTIRHRPEQGYSVQVNNAALLAHLTGIDVVADFRNANIAAGGQGAPLVPAFHEAVFAHPTERRTIINIGGISNVSILIPGQVVRGWDTGPGNTLLNTWCERHTGKPYDHNGAWGATGTVFAPLLTQLLQEPYFQKLPPKSTGRELFNLSWLDAALAHYPELPAQDVQASLVALTAISISRELLHERIEKIYLCGGGARNGALRRSIGAESPNAEILTTDELGVPVDQVEAMAFAWYARRYLVSNTLTTVFGARYPAPRAG